MDELIDIKVSVGLLSTLIAGIYCTYSGVNPVAVPSSMYIEIAERLIPYLKNWDYDKISFEDWVQHELLIIPKEMFAPEEIEECKKNTIYIERLLGNVVIIATGEVEV